MLLAAGATAVGAGVIPAAQGAESPSREAAELREQGALLAQRSRAAVLGLYALESELAHARAQLAAVRLRAAALADERARLRLQLRVAVRSLARSQRLLGERLRALYERGDVDPLDVVLGATSLEDALATLDGLTAAARQDRALAHQAATGRRTLTALSRTVASRQLALRRLERTAGARTRALAAARHARLSYAASLAAQRRLNAAALGRLSQRAAAAVETAGTLTDASAATGSAPRATEPTSAAVGATPSGERTITVSATGYSLPGRTATGLPVGWGVVAVDPSVIPLGTRMTIPGYGGGVAADVGSAVRGATIDIWFPTVAQALAWGRRTVTITLH